MSAAIVHIVDDDDSFRTAISRLLRAAGYETREYASAEAFLAGPPAAGALGCLLLDLRMPGPSGLDLQEALNRSALALPAIFLTGHADVPSTVRAMKSGAADFLTKPVPSKTLLAAVEAAVARSVQAAAGRRELEVLRARYALLTPRERQVFHGVVAGKLNKQIAAELGTVERTVKVQRASMLEKMGASSVPELTRWAERLVATSTKGK